ncbi:hypothetical protein BDL97_09G060400 [Sphagnum fallax]|nr:hypothetical protein BDL97_09G060400 [Sphagnum fallax]
MWEINENMTQAVQAVVQNVKMQHWVAVHKFECHGSKTGSPGSLDTDSWTLSEVHSPGSSRSGNHKVFVDFTDGSNVNEVGPPAQVLLNLDGPTLMQQKLPSLTVDGQQRAKPKKKGFLMIPFKRRHLFTAILVKCILCLRESNGYEPMMDLLVDIFKAMLSPWSTL